MFNFLKICNLIITCSWWIAICKMMLLNFFLLYKYTMEIADNETEGSVKMIHYKWALSLKHCDLQGV